jgi:putative addiction module antidote
LRALARQSITQLKNRARRAGKESLSFLKKRNKKLLNYELIYQHCHCEAPLRRGNPGMPATPTKFTIAEAARGSSTDVVLPKEALARLNVAKGDTLFLTEAPDRYRITPYNPDFERQVELARRVMRDRRNVLRELTK